MRFRTFLLTSMACAGLAACGVTAPDNTTVGYTYVSGDGDGALPNNVTKTPSTTVGNSNTVSGINPGGSGNANTTGTSTAGNSTTGGTSGSNTTTGGTSGGSMSGTTTSSTPTYTLANLTVDMNSVLKAHSPIYSSSNLGNPANIALWTQPELQSLYDGLIATQAFYPSLSLQDLAHLILALGATDSTGDYRLVNGSSTGYLQVSSGSCQTDYTNHGLAITGPDGQLVSPTSENLTDPGANVAMMAWYTRNAVSAGESANEVAANLHDHTVTRDVGNGILSWLEGPGQDRHTLSGSAATNWSTFHDRIMDYYVQAGFGDTTSFETILNASMPATVLSFRDAPSGF